MTAREVARIKRQSAMERGVPSVQPRAKRKAKLKLRFGDRLVAEIRRTREKLDLLIELRTAEEQELISG